MHTNNPTPSKIQTKATKEETKKWVGCNFWTRTYVVQLWNQRFTDWMIRSERAIGECTFEFIVKYSVQHDSYITGTISLDGFDIHVVTALLLTRTSPIWSMKYIPRVQYSYIRKWCQELLIVPASLLVWRVAADISRCLCCRLSYYDRSYHQYKFRNLQKVVTAFILTVMR